MNEVNNNEQDLIVACIPALFRKCDKKGTNEIEILNLSKDKIMIRYKQKIQIKEGEEFLILINPELFNIKNENYIEIKFSLIKNNEEKMILTAKHTNILEENKSNYITILNWFQSVNEYEI